MAKSIVIVEDNELNLRLFCNLLSAHGYKVDPVSDGREAVARVRSSRPDLVVMDIQMPHVSGLDLIETMKNDAELGSTPIMAVTAFANRNDERRIRDAGAEAYVSKPVTIHRFLDEIRSLIG